MSDTADTASGKPLAGKLGIKPGMQLYVRNAPNHYEELLDPMPDDTVITTRAGEHLQFAHVFVHTASQVERAVAQLRPKLADDGMLWISWPKLSSPLSAGLSENDVRDIALDHGMVDVKVCAVDEDWSGLKLVVRRENRS